MSDELERQLDEFYRKLDEPAERMENRWRSSGTRSLRRPSRLSWCAARLTAAAAAALVLLSMGPRGTIPQGEPPVVTQHAPLPPLPPAPAPETPKKPVASPPRIPLPKPQPEPAKPSVDPKPETPKPANPETPKSPKPNPPAPKPEPPAKPPTQVENTFVVLAEMQGSYRLDGARFTKPRKDVRIDTPVSLQAASTVRLALAEDHFVLVKARSRVRLTPREKGLDFALESGEILAELLGAGPDIRVLAPTCEVKPLGTIFSVRVESGRTVVLVEEAQVEVRNDSGKVNVGAGHALLVDRKGTLGTPIPADLRSLAWTRAHRPAVRPLLADDFSKPGRWRATVAGGFARGLEDKNWKLSRVDLVAEKGEVFRIPVQGQVTLTYRVDRSCSLILQFYNETQKLNFRSIQRATSPRKWHTIQVRMSEMTGTRDGKTLYLKPGDRIQHLSIQAEYDETPKGIDVDSIRIDALR